MKNMSSVLLIFSLLFIACSNSDSGSSQNNDTSLASHQQRLFGDDDTAIVIGHVDGDTITFVPDSNTLKSDWQNFLSNNPEIGTCSLTHIQFVTNSGTSEYYLVATGTKGEEVLKSTLLLQLEGTDCLIARATLTCTTTDCSSEALGCIPVVLSCNPCSNKGKCTKTISTGVGMFPSIAPSTCN